MSSEPGAKMPADGIVARPTRARSIQKSDRPGAVAFQIPPQAWLSALMYMLGYQDYGTTNEGPRLQEPRFAWGRRVGDKMAAELSAYSLKNEVDVIYLGFDSKTKGGLPNLTVSNFHKGKVSISENCELWAIPRSDDLVEILSETHRFHINDDFLFVRKPNRLDEMRARRVNLAHSRWEALAVQKAQGATLGSHPKRNVPN